MPPIRHRSRHLRATLYNMLADQLDDLGWISTPINFSADPVTVVDYQPDERNEPVTKNTVAISLGNGLNDEDMELGGATGGLRSGWYPVFIDVYMAEQALTDAICDDIRDIFDSQLFPLINQITSAPSAEQIEVEEVLGPDRPAGTFAAEQFKRYWRVMKLGVRVYYNGPLG